MDNQYNDLIMKTMNVFNTKTDEYIETVLNKPVFKYKYTIRWNHNDYINPSTTQLNELFTEHKLSMKQADKALKALLGLSRGFEQHEYDKMTNEWSHDVHYVMPNIELLDDAITYYATYDDYNGFKLLLTIINNDMEHGIITDSDTYNDVIHVNISNGRLKSFIDNAGLKANYVSNHRITLNDGTRTTFNKLISLWIHPYMGLRTIEFLPGGTALSDGNDNISMNYDNIIAFISLIRKLKLSNINLTKDDVIRTYYRIHDKLGLEGDEYCIQLAKHMSEDDSIFTDFTYDFIMSNHEYPVEFAVQTGSVSTVIKRNVYDDMMHAWNEKTNKPENTDNGSSVYLADCMRDFFYGVYKWDNGSNYKKINYDSSSNTFNGITGLMNERSLNNFSNALINIRNMPDWLVLELNRLKTLRVDNKAHNYTPRNHRMFACCNVQSYQFLDDIHIEQYCIISGFRNMLRDPDTAGCFLIYHEIAMFIACNKNKMFMDIDSKWKNPIFNDVVIHGRINKKYDYMISIPNVIHDVIMSVLNDYGSSDRIKTLVDGHSSIGRVFHDRLNNVECMDDGILEMISNYNKYYDGEIVPDNSCDIWSVA